MSLLKRYYPSQDESIPAVFITNDNLKDIVGHINRYWLKEGKIIRRIEPYMTEHPDWDPTKLPIYHEDTDKWEVSYNIYIRVGDWLFVEPHGGWRTMSDEEFREEYIVED